MTSRKRSASLGEEDSNPIRPTNKKRIGSNPSISDSLEQIQSVFRDRERERESQFNQWLENQRAVSLYRESNMIREPVEL